MKGMELAKAYFEEYGIPMIETSFSQYQGQIAAGLVGEGSECLGIFSGSRFWTGVLRLDSRRCLPGNRQCHAGGL